MEVTRRKTINGDAQKTEYLVTKKIKRLVGVHDLEKYYWRLIVPKC